MTGVLLAAISGLLVVAPHRLALAEAPPRAAVAVWFMALCLRALVVVYAGIFLVLVLPTTATFQVVTHWCWHTAIPLVTDHFGLSGHSIGDVTLLAPVLALSASTLWVCFGLYRAGRMVSLWVRRTSIGPGPQRSTIVGAQDVVVAAAGLRRPRVIVSAGALTAFDDEELAASLAHEHGHIARGHRFILVAAAICRALGRILPGSRTAMQHLVFHLERDADRWAVDRRHDPSALASAICKAATSRPMDSIALMGLGGAGGVTNRVIELLGPTPHDDSRAHPRLRALAVSMFLTVVVMIVAMPAAAAASLDQAVAAQAVRHCPF